MALRLSHSDTVLGNLWRALTALFAIALMVGLLLAGTVLAAGIAVVGAVVAGGFYLWLRFRRQPLRAPVPGARRQGHVIEAEYKVVSESR